MFNQEVAKMHYSKDRLNRFTINQLLDLGAAGCKQLTKLQADALAK